MKTAKLLLSVCSLLAAAFTSQAKEWRGIVPLHSTRADVERLVGKPNDEYDTYDFESERVYIMYSSDPCTEGEVGSYNVPRDTVIGIDVSPKRRLTLSDLGIDLSKYKKSTDPTNEPRALYRNEEEGIAIDTWEGGREDEWKVLEIFYRPAARDSRLRCSAAATKADNSGAEQSNGDTCPSGECPTIEIIGPSGDTCSSQRYSFSAALTGGDPRCDPTFKWSVSAGTIASGQGTGKIEVDANNAGGKPITVTLEVGGVIPKGCRNIQRHTTQCDKPNATEQR